MRTSRNSNQGIVLALITLICISACTRQTTESKIEPQTPSDTKQTTTVPPEQAPLQAEKETTKERVVEKIELAYETAKQYTFEKKEDLKSWAKEKSTDLNSKIDNLEAKVKDAGVESKTKWDTDWKPKLTEKQNAAREKIEKIQDAGNAVWTEARDGAIDALQKLEEAIKSAREDLESDANPAE